MNFCDLRCLVIIGKGVNGAVKRNTYLYPFRILKFLLSFYEVADEISCEYIRIVERKVSMCKKIHLIRLISMYSYNLSTYPKPLLLFNKVFPCGHNNGNKTAF